MSRLDMNTARKIVDNIDEAICRVYALLSLIRSDNPDKQREIEDLREMANSMRDRVDSIRPFEGGKAMKCPLTLHAESVVGNPEQWVYEDCLNQECAWWVEDVRACAVWAIAAELSKVRAKVGKWV